MAFDPDQPRDENNQKWSSFGGGADPKKFPGIAGVTARAKAASGGLHSGVERIQIAESGGFHAVLALNNPSDQQLLDFARTRNIDTVRGLWDRDSGHMVWWNAELAVHDQVAATVGIDPWASARLQVEPNFFTSPMISASRREESWTDPQGRPYTPAPGTARIMSYGASGDSFWSSPQAKALTRGGKIVMTEGQTVYTDPIAYGNIWRSGPL